MKFICLSILSEFHNERSPKIGNANVKQILVIENKKSIKLINN